MAAFSAQEKAGQLCHETRIPQVWGPAVGTHSPRPPSQGTSERIAVSTALCTDGSEAGCSSKLSLTRSLTQELFTASLHRAAVRSRCSEPPVGQSCLWLSGAPDIFKIKIRGKISNHFLKLLLQLPLECQVSSPPRAPG